MAICISMNLKRPMNLIKILQWWDDRMYLGHMAYETILGRSLNVLLGGQIEIDSFASAHTYGPDGIMGHNVSELERFNVIGIRTCTSMLLVIETAT